MKMIYETPVLELIRFSSADVITASDDTADDTLGIGIATFDFDGVAETNA